MKELISLNILDICLACCFFLSTMCFAYLTGKENGRYDGMKIYKECLDETLDSLIATGEEIEKDGESDDT